MKGKKIILCISGSIAAYKAAFLTRLLIKAGAEVQILMTPAATQFITPITLATLSKRPVHTEIISENSWNSHVELGLWADAMIVAPATSTTLSKMATANCDNIVVATYLSARCPVFIAPAMDLDMWKHPATVRNLKHLNADGVQLIPVGTGELASGLVGDGRMAEPEEIMSLLETYFQTKDTLTGKKIVVTAGPTYEAIDPVRFIGNRSSGKMGLLIAEAAAKRGAQVKLILGPSVLSTEIKGIETIRVQSAQEMFDAAQIHFTDCHVAILSAAVADYRPSQVSDIKIKKKDEHLTIDLVKTQDIAATLGAQKKKGQLLIGFALETNNELENAIGKLERKKFDFIVLNSLQDKGAGFGHDTNKISIVFDRNNIKHHPLKEKKEVAEDIVSEIVKLLA
jgi:phosphopantothenoylcysteine decarboxylase / phosphopantothenate---cysteine ligase